MKNLIFLWTLCFLAFTQAGLSYAAEDAKQALREKLVGLQQFKANFQQTVVDSNDEIVQQSKGVLTLVRPNKLRWQTTEPDETLLIADGESLWYVDTFVEQVTVTRQITALNSNPFLLLTSENDADWEAFRIVKSDGIYTVTPTENSSGIQTLELVFEGAVLTTLTTTDTQLQRSTLVFSEISLDDPLSEQLFLVVIPDGYQLDDQR